MNTTWMNNVAVPQVKIVEQPSSKGTRFRYECEGRFSNNISGASGKKSFPTIRIVNYIGPLSIIVSCVTKDPPYKPHPHKLVNENHIHEHGICLFRIPANNTHDICFQHLSIQCTGKRNIVKSLSERERVQIDPFNTGFMHKLKPENIDLNCIRLCFQVFIETAQSLIPLKPIVSQPIFDKKAVNDLRICWLSHHSASVIGGTQMCILCEKVSKLDIEVRFFHEESHWEAIAMLTKPEVFRQVAIVFETPEYRTTTCSPEQVQEPLNVLIELRRISDRETSPSISFQLLPLTSVYYESNVTSNSLKRKREKYNQASNGIISKRIQAEVIRNPCTINAKLSKNLNVLESKNFKLPALGETSMKTELWELPPLNESNYLQQQSLSTPQMNNYVNVLNESTIVETAQISNQNHYNIESKDVANSLLTYQKCGSADTLNSDSWINDLLETINQEGYSAALTNETIISNNIARSPQTYFSSVNQINNNSLPYTNMQQTDNFINNADFIQESNSGSFIHNLNISDVIKGMNSEEQDFFFNKNEPVQKDNTLTEESVQEFINLLQDLS